MIDLTVHDGIRLLIDVRLEPNRRSLPWPILFALVVGGMAATTNSGVTGLLVTSIAEDLDRSVALIGGLRALGAAVAFVTAFPLSRVADQYPRKYLISVGLVSMVISGVIAMTAPNLTFFLGYYVFAGITDVILFAMLLAAASDYIDGPGLDRANGVVIGAFGLPGFVVVPLAGVISDEFGWRQAYFLNIGIALLALAAIGLLLPKARPTGTKPESMFGHLRMLAGKPGLMLVLAGNLLRFTILTALIVYTAAFLIERYDLSDGRAGFYYGIGSAVFLVAAFASGLLIARIGLYRIMVPGGMILAGALLIGFLPGNSGLLTGAALLISGSLLSIQENGALGAILRLAPNDRGAATSLNEIGAAISGILGSALGGLVIQWSGFAGLGVFLAAIGVGAFAVTHLSVRALPAEPATGREVHFEDVSNGERSNP